jgi:CubicO group peptidase (beta-lactamase class C family)
MERYIARKGWEHEIDAILMVRDGYLVYESYPSGSYGPEDTHHIYSCTKSFTSALVGIAVDRAYVDLDAPVVDLVGGDVLGDLDARKRLISVEDLLTMRSGLGWDDARDYYRMEKSADWVDYVLSRPMAATPGVAWNYNTGNTHLLSAILDNSVPGGVVSFAAAELFTPLGISSYLWVTDVAGLPIGGTGLNVTARDMAKLGYLYLQGGAWDGQQILSPEWVAQSTTPHVTTEFDQGHGFGYGYLWWIYEWDTTYAARGSYGQYILVVPELEIFVVLTGSGSFDVTVLLEDFILPSARDRALDGWAVVLLLLGAAGTGVVLLQVVRASRRH